MRPSIKVVETASWQTVVIDTALVNSKDVLIAAVGSVGNLSSKILSESHLVAFSVEYDGKAISAQELAKVLKYSGFPVENGIVVVRAGEKQDLTSASGLAEVTIEQELKLDHVLSLLMAAKPEVK